MTTSSSLAGFGFPPCDPDAPLRAAEASADRLVRILRVARSLARAHRAVDIVGFDGLVGRLCAQSLDLPLQDGPRMRPRLAALLKEMAALEAALTRPP